MNQKNKYLIAGGLSLVGCFYFAYLALSGGTQENLLVGSVGLGLVSGYFIGLSKKY